MDKVKLIAFYLPQYHEIPENNKWWGEGFTEWTNVTKAKPLFEAHRQPRVPTKQLGYYDLSKIEAIEKQAELAIDHGVDGFCFYHYWFDGKKLLESPLQNMLKSKKPDFPFCVCWANENWTRTWDGQQQKVLISQNHSPHDDLAFINDLIEVFKDERYIKVDGKPLLAIYRTSLFPDIKKSAVIWRQAAKKAGFKDLYLARVEGIELELDPKEIGFDAGIEFAPDWRLKGPAINQQRSAYRDHIDKKVFDPGQPTLYDYNLAMSQMVNRKVPAYKYLRGVFPDWDNTPRRAGKGTVFWGASPEAFGYYLSRQIENTAKNKLLNEQEKLVFVNAWNEWGEGCYLEPDTVNGLKLLQAVKQARSSQGYQDQPLHATANQLVKHVNRAEEEVKKLDKAYQDAERNSQLDRQRLKEVETEINQLKNSRTWKTRNKLAKIIRKPVI